MEKADGIAIEVVYGDCKNQALISLKVDQNSTVEEAIIQSGILEQYPHIDLHQQAVGIFSKKVALSDPLSQGDRIEIYRPLTIDPKEARRRRSKKKA